jgi:putative membrane protein
MGGVMLFVWTILIAAVLVGGVLMVRGLRAESRQSGSARREDRAAPDALRIVEERYARGEIDRQEFEERRRTLEDLDPR